MCQSRQAGEARHEISHCIRYSRLGILLRTAAAGIRARAGCASAAARRYSLPRPEKRSAARLCAEEGDCHAERHGGYSPMCARQLRHRGGPDGARVSNPRGLCRPAGRGAAGVCHARTSIQHENTASVVSGRCAAARTYAYSGMGAVWQGKPVSEPGFSVHPEK